MDVLVVDDSDFIRGMVSAICSRHDWTMEGAATIAEARVALASSPSVVILDFHMPDGDGTELVDHIAEGTTVIGLSMQPRKYTRDKYAAKGIDIVLDKETIFQTDLAKQLGEHLGPR